MRLPGTGIGLKSLFTRPRGRASAAAAVAPRPSRVVFHEPLEERVLMALSSAGGGSGYSGTLSTNPTIRQQQLICDPHEPAAGSTSVQYNASLVTLADLEYGPGYGPRVVNQGEFFDVIQGYVQVFNGESTVLQRIESFFDEPAGVETGYVQVWYQQDEGEPGQMTVPEGNFVDDEAGVEGVDTHALYFNPVEEDDGDGDGGDDVILLDSHQHFALAQWDRVAPSYRIFAARAGQFGNNVEDFLLTQDGVYIGPDELSEAVVTTNTGPQITSLSTNAGTLGTAASEGQNVSLTGTFFNLNPADTHAALVNWGDGNTTPIIPATSPVTASHAYALGGVYDVTLTVMDDDGQSDTESTRVYVAGASARGGVLQVVGTGGDDRVEISTKDTDGDGRDDKVRVSANFIPGYHRFFDIAGIQVVHVQTGGGNDKVSVWGSVPADSVIEGGDGADTLYAGRRSLLVGGAGADSLNGADGNDTLIPGISPHAGDLPELLAILNGLETTMIDDLAVDTVSGNRGVDTFYLNATDLLKDPYLGRDGVERFFFV